MKKIIEFVRNIMICALAALFITGCFLGAVLQESYKLDPVTQDEIMEVENV